VRILGVDPAQAVDWFAIAGVETKRDRDGAEGWLRLLERYRGESYVDLATHVAELADRHRIEIVAIDGTGVGAPYRDQLALALKPYPKIRLIPIMFSSGAKATHKTKQWTVPKPFLIEQLLLMFEKGRFHIPQGQLDLQDALIHEFEVYRGEQLPSGKMRYGNKPGGDEHDDLVTAVAVATYVGTSEGGLSRARLLTAPGGTTRTAPWKVC
jgi:hypothetical protein